MAVGRPIGTLLSSMEARTRRELVGLRAERIARRFPRADHHAALEQVRRRKPR